ncbi:MAG: response regulator [Deltaproteobacteria bacterium]|nr:response regulator [Deltaproteobacteria bacterium]
MLYRTTSTVSRDYAMLYSSKSIGILNTYLNREIALLKYAANSPAIIEWFADENNPQKRRRAHEEMMLLLNTLYSDNLYFGIENSRNEYSVTKTPLEHFTSFAKLNPDAAKDAWYFRCAAAPTDYELNVDIDKFMHRKLVWLNYKVTDANGKILGVLCTGLQFDSVIDEIFGEYDTKNIRGLVINAQGIIQMDSALRGLDSTIIYDNPFNINGYFQGSYLPEIRTHLESVNGFFESGISPNVIKMTTGEYDYVSIAPIQSTNWTVVTYYSSSSLFNLDKLKPLFIALLALLVIYTIAITLFNHVLIFVPFNKIMGSIVKIDEKNENTIYGTERSDEFGSLSRTIRDMKDRLVSHNAKLVEAMQRADRANQAKTDFLANMSHEIRTPLNAVIGMTAIGKDATDPPKKKYAFEKIEIASKHLLGVINDILDMSKIEAGKFEISSTEFNFEKMLQRAIDVIYFRVEEKKQRFSVRIDPDIPKTLIGDYQRLAQIIANLLSNAVKFTPEHGNISLEACSTGEELDENSSNDYGRIRLRIAISDTGIGISTEQKAHLFQAFQQAESSTARKFGGTGLGLAISKKIVEMMNGDISFESKPDMGSTFIFTVPLDYPRTAIKSNTENHLQTVIPEKDEDAATLGEQASFAGHRLLLVEDVEINREIVLELLAPCGVDIDCAENGLEAVRMFSAAPESYNLIFMDVQMPELDGYETTQRIRALNTPWAAKVPIVAMTANVFREDIEKCLAIGMDGHVGKPLDLNEVMAVLRKYLI